MAGRADAFPSGALAAPRLEGPDHAERHLVLGVVAGRSAPATPRGCLDSRVPLRVGVLQARIGGDAAGVGLVVRSQEAGAEADRQGKAFGLAVRTEKRHVPD